MIRCLPLGSMRGSCSSSPMIWASSSSDSSTSSACSPAWSPALPLPSALGSPLPRLSPTSPSPCPTPPRSLLPNRKRGTLICGKGIETRSFPLRPISSPCEMYLRRSCLIFPRTMSRNRRWSGSIRSAIRSPPSDHQIDEAPRRRIVDAEAVPLGLGRDGLLEHAQRAREHSQGLVGLEVTHQLDQQRRSL